MVNPVRDTVLGDFIRFVSGRQWLKYPEDDLSFVLPHQNAPLKENKIPTGDVENGKEIDRNAEPVDVNEGNEIMIDWYSPTDPDNPQNWSVGRKTWMTLLISVYSFVVYCASAIFIPSYPFMMYRYGVSLEVARLALSIYVVGYGVGPLILSPLSEIPSIGRNPPYVYSFVLFLVISIILAEVDNFPAIIVLRFLQGFFGSPCLASGGATIEDMFSWSAAPYIFIFWVGALYCGPALGPLLAAYAVPTNWRWPLWEIVIMAAPFLIVMVCLLPETSHETILLHRAQRLRRINPHILAPSETRRHGLKNILVDALIKPVEILIKDPAIGYISAYTGLVYATYYSFFQAFPIAFGGTYQMAAGSQSLMFLAIIVGCLFGSTIYAAYLKFFFYPRYQHRPPVQEDCLFAAIPATCFLSAGLFIFAWTARSDIYWIVPAIGVTIYAGSAFIVFQAILVYVPLSYPRYVASLFAANDFVRSIIAAGFVMFTQYMYEDLGIDSGVTLLAGLSVGGILGMIFIYLYGGRLRARSKFAAKD